MKRRIVWGVILAVFLLILAFLSYWVLILGFLAVACVILYRLAPSPLGRTSAVVLVATGCILIVLYGFGFLRAAGKVGTCESNVVSKIERLASKQGSGFDQAASVARSFQEDFRQRAFRFRNRARGTLYVDSVVEEASVFLDNPGAVKETPDYVALYDALQKLRSFLRDHAFLDRATRRQSIAELSGQLEALMDRSRQADTPVVQQALDEELLAVTNKSLLFELDLKQGIVQALARKLVGAIVEPQTKASIVFDGSRFDYIEEITFTTTRGELLRIDAEPLKREAELEGMQHALLVRQNNEVVPVSQVDRIPITPGLRSVTLISHRYSTRGTGIACRQSPLSPIRRLEPRWPYPYRIQLSVVTKSGLGNQTSAVELPREAKIEDIRVPLWSFYASKDDLTLAQKEGFDVLSQPKEALTQATFRSGEGFWIETVAGSPVVRNPLVQKYRQYLLADHAIVALFVLVLGAVVTGRLLK